MDGCSSNKPVPNVDRPKGQAGFKQVTFKLGHYRLFMLLAEPTRLLENIIIEVCPK
jgi:hypothetical protein